MTANEAIRVLVTGAASKVGYILCASIAAGHIFGAKQSIILHLLDIPEEAGHMESGVTELYDCAFPLLKQIIPTCDPVVAFQDISAAFLLGGVELTSSSWSYTEVMSLNAHIFRDQGRCLDAFARKDCKVLVAAVPCHTMTYICTHFAPTIPKENFSALARLDHNCALGQLALKLDTSTNHLKNVWVWGNHSETTFADAWHASVLQGNQYKRVVDVLNDDHYLRNQFIETVSHRRESTRKLSVAKAAADQMHDWWLGTAAGHFVSMGILSDGSYGVPKDLIFSFPVEVQKGRWIIAKGLKMDEFSKAKIDATIKELIIEKSEAFAELDKD